MVLKFGMKLLVAGAAMASLAGAAQAQDITSWTNIYGFEEGYSTDREYNVEGLWVSLAITDSDTILGEPKIYARVTFCNESSNPWSGGQRISPNYPSSSHATLRVPAGDCRSWSEWIRADATEIHVYLRRAP